MKQDNLNSFLAVAERLRVRGLCQNDGSSSSNSTNSKSSRHSQAEKPKPPSSRLAETPTGSSSSFTEPALKRPRVSQDDDIEEIPPTTPVVKQEMSAANQHEAESYQLAENYDESMQGSEYGEEYYEDEMGYSAAEGAMMDPSQSKGRRQYQSPSHSLEELSSKWSWTVLSNDNLPQLVWRLS